MTAQLAAYGRLVAEPASRITKNDNQRGLKPNHAKTYAKYIF